MDLNIQWIFRIEENEFFRQVALSICSNLKIEVALRSCIQSLKKVIPLDRIFLQYYDQSFGAMRTIASATPNKCSKMDLLTPPSEKDFLPMIMYPVWVL